MQDQQPPLAFNDFTSGSFCVAYDQGDGEFYIGFDAETTAQCCREGETGIDVAQISKSDLPGLIEALTRLKEQMLKEQVALES